MTGQKRVIISIGLMSLCLSATAFAQGEDELAAAIEPVQAPGPDPISFEIPDIRRKLFVGTAQNSTDPRGTLNDVFSVNPINGRSASILEDVGVWGATFDPQRDRVLFTRSSGEAGTFGGDELFAVPCGGGRPTSLGLITLNGQPLRIDGLAMDGGILYGSMAGGGEQNGLYTIRLDKPLATKIRQWDDRIGGLADDPDVSSGIFGVNDSTRKLVRIDTRNGTMSDLVDYPADIDDIDGLAMRPERWPFVTALVYLVTDEDQPISVYALRGAHYARSLESPFENRDIFSGAAYCDAERPQSAVEIPTVSRWGLALLATALVGLSLYVLRRWAL